MEWAYEEVEEAGHMIPGALLGGRGLLICWRVWRAWRSEQGRPSPASRSPSAAVEEMLQSAGGGLRARHIGAVGYI